MEEKKTVSKLAIASLIFGISAVVFVPGAILAIILSETFRYNNKQRINKGEPVLEGGKIAWAGFGLGLLFLAIRLIEIFL